MSGLMTVGTSGLLAAYAQLQTTGHNIANANTPGYTRQEVELNSAGGMFSGAGFVGQGVEVASVRRRYDEFLAREVSVTGSASAADTARAEQLNRLEQLFADSETGIGVAIDEFNSGLADVANRPADASARTVAMRRADTLAERIRGTDGQLRRMRDDVDENLVQSAREATGLLQQLAKVNDRIANVYGTGKAPNDLLDDRDRLIEKVNGHLSANAYLQPDGTVSLFAAGGQALVISNKASTISAQTDPLDSSKIGIMLQANGVDMPMDPQALGGGKLAGLLEYRDDDLEAARYRLGQLAAGIAQAFNDQQALGSDATGASGTKMFGLGVPETTAAANNGGDAELAAVVADGGAMAASDYSIAFDGGNWQVTRLSDGVTTSHAGWPQTIDGVTVSLASGSPAAGDRFLLRSASSTAAKFELALSSPSRLATGMPMAPQLGAGNGGDVSVAGFAITGANANLTQPVTLTFTAAGTFDVSGTGTGNATGVAYAAGQPIEYNGWKLTLQGTPKAGDTLTVVPTPDPASDNRNVRAMIGLADKPTVDGETFSESVAAMISDVGSRTQSAQSSAQLSDRLAVDAQAARSAVSGVNLDEEAARLLQYQQAYQAAAKVLATAQSMFDSLMAAAGR